MRAGKEERSFKLSISAHLNPPSLHPQSVLYPISSSPLTVAVRLMPPLSFFLKPMLGGLLFKRIPKPSNSFSIIFLCPKGFRTSRTIKIKLHVRATGGKKWHLKLNAYSLYQPKNSNLGVFYLAPDWDFFLLLYTHKMWKLSKIYTSYQSVVHDLKVIKSSLKNWSVFNMSKTITLKISAER